jgi:hypothetical protein
MMNLYIGIAVLQLWVFQLGMTMIIYLIYELKYFNNLSLGILKNKEVR